MERVGIRELKQRASDVVRRAASGETIEVTDRGRPVAQIGPLPPEDPWERMIRTGEIVPATGHLLDHEPVRLPPGISLSATLAQMRDEDDR